MDFTTLVQKRHSTRDFSDQVIPRSQLEQIIQDALTTPSGQFSTLARLCCYGKNFSFDQGKTP